jgi:membrane protease YdiL (CAAX protease family)
MPTAVWLVLTAFQLIVITGSMIGWAFALARVSSRRPIYPYRPRRPVPWGLLDLGVVAFASLSTSVMAYIIAASLMGVRPGADMAELSPWQFGGLVVSGSIASLAVLGLVLVWLRWRVHAGPQDFGIDFGRLDADVGLGLIGFVMLAVPVFAIQLGLAYLFPEQEQHPLIKMLKAQAHPGLMLVAGFVAVVAAPIVEEYFFRVLLQGWLENVACRSDKFHELLFGASPAGEPSEPSGVHPAETNGTTILVAEDVTEATGDVRDSPGTEEEAAADRGQLAAEIANPYRSPEMAWEGRLVAARAEPRRMRPRYWPIVVSATVFALMHLGHGYDPIPLFFLAVGLGYLYQQTHRVLPCIVVHLLLNATSLVLLWVGITYGENL